MAMCNEINWTSETKIFHLPPWTLTKVYPLSSSGIVRMWPWNYSVEAKVTSIAIRGAGNSLCSGPTILNCSKRHNYMTRPFLFSSFSVSTFLHTQNNGPKSLNLRVQDTCLSHLRTSHYSYNIYICCNRTPPYIALPFICNISTISIICFNAWQNC